MIATEAVSPVSTVVLSTDQVTKRFGAITAVDEVSLEIRSGEVVGVVGPNGSGKSTLLNLVTLIERPTRGTIEVFGRPTRRMGVHRVARLGVHYSFQRTRLLPEMTVENHVAMALANHRVVPSFSSRRWVSDDALRQKVVEAVGRFHLDHVRDNAASELSFGQRQLLSLCMAAVRGSRLILLDEPLAGLSGESIAIMAEQFTQLAQDGVALVVVEHRLRSLIPLCSRFLALDRGRIIADGVPAEVMDLPEVMDAYFGRGTST